MSPHPAPPALAPDAMASLLPAERMAVAVASAQVARGDNPPAGTIAALLTAIGRLTGEPLEALGTGPLLDPGCRAGKCGSCTGPPCEHECHRGGA